MTRKFYSLNSFGEGMPAFRHFVEQHNDSNTERRKKMLTALNMALEDELTARQREVINLYYFENMTVTSIALRLSVNKSTISRILKRAHNRLNNIFKYTINN